MTKPYKLEAFEDPNHPGNGYAHLNGRVCVEPGCGKPAGTQWSPLWCMSCNIVRMKRISAGLEGALQASKSRAGGSALEAILASVRSGKITARPSTRLDIVELPEDGPPEAGQSAED